MTIPDLRRLAASVFALALDDVDLRPSRSGRGLTFAHQACEHWAPDGESLLKALAVAAVSELRHRRPDHARREELLATLSEITAALRGHDDTEQHDGAEKVAAE